MRLMRFSINGKTQIYKFEILVTFQVIFKSASIFLRIFYLYTKKVASQAIVGIFFVSYELIS